MKLFCIAISILLCPCAIVLAVASSTEFEWGRQGLGMNSRFMARSHFKNGQSDKQLFEILVGSKETVKDTASMQILSQRGDLITSNKCWKAYRFLESPWACTFLKADLTKLAGKGEIKIANQSGKTVLTDRVNLDALINFVTKLE